MSYTEAHYVTQNGAGTKTGRTLANAWSLTDFQNSANWSTYNSVDSKIGPGDVVYFSGNFTSQVIVLNGGNSNGSVTLDGFEGGDTDPVNTINTGTALLTQGMDVGATTHGPDYLTIQDFRMTRNNSTDPCFRFYGNISGSDAEKHLEHCIVQRNYVYQTNGTMFYWYGGRYNIIQDNKFVNFGQNGTKATQGINFIQLHYSVARRNIFGHDEINYPSGGGSAEMVEIHGCQSLLMEYNDIYGAPNQSGIRPKEHMWRESRDIVLRFNKIHDNLGLATGETIGNGIHAHTNYYNGVNDRIVNLYIYGNYVYNNIYGILFGKGLEGGVHVWANIASANTRYGIGVWTSLVGPLYVVNNTIARNNTSNETDVSRGGLVLSNTATAGVHVKNNLFWNNRPAGERYRSQIHTNYALTSLEHNRYFHSLGDITIRYNGDYRTLAYMKGLGFENVSPAGSIVDPLFVSPSGDDGVYGTADDNCRLSHESTLIDAGGNITGSFSVDLSNGDAWFETNSGYGTLNFGYDDALDPILTDWTT